MVDSKKTAKDKNTKSKEEPQAIEVASILSFHGERLDVENVKVSAYDFKKPPQFSSLDVVFLQQIYQDWLRSFQTYLTLTLKSDVQVIPTQFEIESYSDFFKRVNDPSAVVLLGDISQGNIGFWTFPMSFALSIVRKLLGGVGKESIEARPLTAIEKSLFLQFIEGCLEHFEKNIYAEVKLKNLKVLGLESGLRFIPKPNKLYETYFSQISDWTLEEENFSCGFSIPSVILDPILKGFREERNKLNPSKEQKKCLWRDVYKDIDIPVTAEWEKEVSIKDIMTWEAGTVLDFAMPTLEKTVLKANGISKFIGSLGLESGRVIFNVGEKYNERDE